MLRQAKPALEAGQTGMVKDAPVSPERNRGHGEATNHAGRNSAFAIFTISRDNTKPTSIFYRRDAVPSFPERAFFPFFTADIASLDAVSKIHWFGPVIFIEKTY